MKKKKTKCPYWPGRKVVISLAKQLKMIGAATLLLSLPLSAGLSSRISPSKQGEAYLAEINRAAVNDEPPEFNCETTGGSWRVFSNGCADSCLLASGAKIACTLAMTEGCDCGSDKCWGGAGCVPNPPNETVRNYILEPSEKQISIPVHLPYEGYGVNVLLKQNGRLIVNQSDIYYKWINDGKYIKIEDQDFQTGCPYKIENPCNNLHATIHGLVPGSTRVIVEAYQQGVKIAETDIQVKVSDSQYTLEPSDKEITIKKNTAYGVNVLLKKNNYLILDQQSIKYIWKSHDNNIITINDNGFEKGCPYNINSPCPNLHASIYGVNLGKTQIEIEAWLRNTLLEVAYISVIVNSSSYPYPSPKPSDSVCGNNVCEAGEADFSECPACLNSTPPCMAPCVFKPGTCPQDCEDEPKPTLPPDNCYYQQIECIQTPCEPILVCPTSSPVPAPSYQPIPSYRPQISPKPYVKNYDLNNDGRIDWQDAAIIISNIFTKNRQTMDLIDLNNDGKVNVLDYKIFKSDIASH